MIANIARAFSPKLRQITPNAAESRQLQAAGIVDPTVQAYFLWRRSLVSVVVVATILSAVFATYRAVTQDDEQQGALEIQVETLLDHAKSKVPVGTTGLLKAAGNQLATAAEEMSEEDDEEEEKPGGETTNVVATDHEDDDNEKKTAFAQFNDWVEMLSLYTLPLASILVLFCWTNFRLSSRILLIGWAFSFFVLMGFAFCPWEWFGEAETDLDPENFSLDTLRMLARDANEGVQYIAMLLPAVLSLIPGIQKACLKVKTLLPESVLPGWFLVAAAPFYSLLLLVIFIAFYQFAGETSMLAGMLLFIAAPFLYIVRADAFTRPLLTEDDIRGMKRAQQMITIATLLAGILLLHFVLTQELFGIRIIGLDAKTALLTPLDLVEFGVEIIGRSMFMMVLGADLFMRMNLATWKNQRELAASPAAARYDHTMAALDQVA
jgi:hypothetical protein